LTADVRLADAQPLNQTVHSRQQDEKTNLVQITKSYKVIKRFSGMDENGGQIVKKI